MIRRWLLIIGLFAAFSFSLLPVRPTSTLAQSQQSPIAPIQTNEDELCSDATTGTKRNCTLSERIATPSGYVYNGWRIMRGAVNTILILALLLISFSNIARFNIDTYTVKKALPNLVIGVLLANASFLIIRYLADIATVAIYFFVGMTQFNTFSEFISGALATIGVNTILTLGSAAGTLSYVFAIVLVIITIIGLFWLAFLLYIRLIAVYLLTILAPLAFVAYGVPGFEKYFKMWWEQFIKWLFMLVVMVAILWVQYVICTSGGGNQSIARTVTCYFLFFMAMAIPSKFGGSVISKASTAFGKYTGVDAGKKWMKETGEREGKILRAKSPIGRLDAWMALNKANREKLLENLTQRQKTKASSGRSGDTAKSLDLEAQGLAIEDEIQNLGKEKLARQRDEVGVKLAQLAEAKKLNELGLDELKLQDEQEAIRKDKNRTELIKAEYRKQQAEAQKNALQSEKKLDFVNDSRNEQFLRNVYGDVNEADHYSGAITSSENILKGGLSGEELILAKHAKTYSSLAKTDPRRARIKAQYDELRRQSGHSFFKDLDIDSAAAAITGKTGKGKIIDAKNKQAAKAVDAGMNAANEDGIKGQTHQESMKDINDLYDDLDVGSPTKPGTSGTFQRLASGDTIGIDATSQFKFQSHVHKQMAWARDRNDPRRDDALSELMRLHQLGGGTPITIQTKKRNGRPGRPITISTQLELDNLFAAGTLDDDDKSKVLTAIAKNNPYMAGSASYKTAHTK